MADQETKLNMKLSMQCEIKKVDGDKELPFADLSFSGKYNNMDYLQVVATQQAMTDLGQSLTNLGWAQAEQIGFVVDKKGK